MVEDKNVINSFSGSTYKVLNSIDKGAKKFRNIYAILLITLAFIVFVSASAVFTDNYIDVPYINSSAISNFFGGANFNNSALSNVGNATINGDITMNNGYIYNSSSIDEINMDGMVMSFSFNDQTIFGGYLLDGSGYSNDGVLTGSPATSTTGSYNGGRYMVFDGSDDKVTIPGITNDSLGFSTSGVSYSFWYKASATSAKGGIVGESADSTGIYVQHGSGTSAGNQVKIYVWDADSASFCNDGPTVPDTNFHHYVMIYDSDNQRIYGYRDGAIVSNSSCTYTPKFSTSTVFYVGNFRRFGDVLLNGSLDDVKVFNRVLDSQEVNQLKNQVKSGDEPFLSKRGGTIAGNLSIEGIIDQIYLGNTTTTYNETKAGRPLVSNSGRTMTVCSSGCTYTTIQEAMQQVPFILRHPYTISVSAGTYPEDVYVPAYITTYTQASEGSVGGLSLGGNSSNPDSVQIKSIQVSNAIGQWAFSGSGFTVYSAEPRSDEGTCISVYGTGTSAIFQHINVTCSATHGIMGYGSEVYVHSTNFNGSQSYCMLIKRGGTGVFGDDYLNSWNTGSCSQALVTGSNSIIDIDEHNAVTAPRIAKCNGEDSAVITYRSKMYCIGTDNDYGFSSDGLLIYYPFDQSTTDYGVGNTSIDTQLGISYSSAKYGYGINSSSVASGWIGNHTFGEKTGTQATISVWLNASGDQSMDATIFEIGPASEDLGSNNFLAFRIDDTTGGRDDYQFSVANNTFRGYYWSTANDSNTYAGRWTHVAFTLGEGGVAKYYRNGQLVSTGTIGNSITFWHVNDTYNTLTIGKNYTGSIDNLMVWDRELNAGEIESVYESFSEPINKNAFILKKDGFNGDCTNKTITVVNGQVTSCV